MPRLLPNIDQSCFKLFVRHAQLSFVSIIHTIPPRISLVLEVFSKTHHACYGLLFFFFNFYFILFIYLLLCWVFVSARGPSPIAASGGHSSSRCAGLSPSRPLLLRSTGSRRAGSVIVAHGPSRSAARGILPDQGPNPRPLHWQADSQPLRHQGSPWITFDGIPSAAP